MREAERVPGAAAAMSGDLLVTVQTLLRSVELLATIANLARESEAAARLHAGPLWPDPPATALRHPGPGR